MNAFYFLIKLTTRNLRRVKIGLGGSFVGSIYAENFIINIKKDIKKWILYSKCMINGWLSVVIIENDAEKTKHLLVQSHTSHSDTKLKDFKIREAIYI
ncbi:MULTISPECIES: hypothetical protein [unclassified Clostridium]|uniref:hypothetical protein n=1 Tax=unclassified Clostridium TaxID=2614128 RepID=UPI001C6E9B0C|nr:MULTISPECIES: hypothetical protein [unclassified Clostridium]MBW9147136.1 hypothetical protein [Clostridium sp. CM027]UVE42207.1 hypothetical protein KTC92_07125 [Clostridium sp. CM027]WLC62793.1 hypothetical protein KTC94_05925 [Clostridium sp. CM028]